MNPFGSGDQLREWDALFRVRITDKHRVVGGDLDGTWLYGWVEQSFTATGLPQDANPGRSGTADNSPAVEINNLEVEVGSYALLRTRGAVGGQLWYEFAAGGSAENAWDPILVTGPAEGTSGEFQPVLVLDKATREVVRSGLLWLLPDQDPVDEGTYLGGFYSGVMPDTAGTPVYTKNWPGGGGDKDATGCGWVAGLTKDDCLRLTVLGGVGSCSCVAPQDPLGMSYSGGVWVPDDDATFNLCSPTDPPYRAAFDPGGCNGPCLTVTPVEGTGSGAGVVLTRGRCGRNWVEFFGPTLAHAADCGAARDDSAGPAGNVYRIRVEWVPCVPPPEPFPCDVLEGIGGSVLVSLSGDTDGTVFFNNPFYLYKVPPGTYPWGPWTNAAVIEGLPGCQWALYCTHPGFPDGEVRLGVCGPYGTGFATFVGYVSEPFISLWRIPAAWFGGTGSVIATLYL